MVFDPNDSDATSVDVQLAERSYRIEIRSAADEQLAASVVSTLGDMSHALMIADQSVADPWAARVASELQAQGVRVDTYLVPSGEPSKSISQYETLLQWMLDAGADRRSVVVAVGGGVIGDLAGFAAASFTRGIRFVQIPTTLLAMVDSSVGGKTGINLPTAKNMVGAFWQPSLVWIDTDVLSTLPHRDYISGLAEVIKYGVIDDKEFFQWLENNCQALIDRDATAIRFAIARSCQSKANVVGADERETSGRRAILNYGHTFAHAIEATAGYGVLTHGEAVAIGMQMAAELAVSLGMCQSELLRRQTTLLTNCGLPITFPDADPQEMLPVMQRDKKVAHGKLRFILPTQLGAVDLVGDIAENDVVAAIQACK